METFLPLFGRWPSLNLSVTCLLALLQRTPVVRVAAMAEEFVLQSPASAMLRSAAATLGALGAVHTLAGATQFVVTPSENVAGTVGQVVNVAFTITGSPTPPFFFKVGALPPGLVTIPAADATGTVQSGTPIISGTPTQAGQFSVTVTGSDGLYTLDGTIRFNIAAGTAVTDVAPAFTAQPATQTVSVGANVTFGIGASGTPTPTYQWRKNGNAIAGATNSTLALANVQLGDAGSYTCVATNSAGSATSNAATLTVNATVATGTAPTLSVQPVSLNVASGSTAVFTIAASGNPAPTFQWSKGGVVVPGATSSTLILRGATAADAGTYTCVATNTGGSATSSSATLSISNTTDFGRISNLSVLTGLSASEGLFTVGVSIGGNGTGGTKPLVIRAGGPALSSLGVGGVLPDPKLDVLSGSTVVVSNDNWGGSVAATSAFSAVGAFPFGATSKDAAVTPTLAAGGYTIQVRDAGNATGTVIAELYDATPSGSFTSTTPRLINVSVLKQIDPGAVLTVGFFIGGSTAKTVLVRVGGPTLTSLGVGGAMPDPKLDVFSGSSVIASNDNWGGDPTLATTAKSVGAFDFISATSKDAMLLITLAPGGYTVQASGVSGSSGLAIVEVYEVP